ncbi:hypothetical protein Ddc_21344 [Ditylenchus destructor]|nr:hypothetical protein Ddc_21344 [Ditylenchus destructor]
MQRLNSRAAAYEEDALGMEAKRLSKRLWPSGVEEVTGEEQVRRMFGQEPMSLLRWSGRKAEKSLLYCLNWVKKK